MVGLSTSRLVCGGNSEFITTASPFHRVRNFNTIRNNAIAILTTECWPQCENFDTSFSEMLIPLWQNINMREKYRM